MNNLTIQKHYRVLALFIFFFLSACGGGGGGDTGNTTEPTGSIEIITPMSLSTPAVSGIRVRISVNGAATEDFTLDSVDRATLADIQPGTYQLEITYYVSALLETTLATVTETVSVGEGETVALTPNDIALNRNYDDDSDGYTNLAEVRIGTNPQDVFDKPGEGSPTVSLADGSPTKSASASYSLSARSGEPIGGEAISINYKITHGLQKDQ